MGDSRSPVFIIGVASGLLGLHQHTLRIYEVEGLVKPARRSNQRLYSEDDLEIIRHIRYLTSQAGVNLAGVRLLLALESSGRASFKEIQALSEGDGIEDWSDGASPKTSVSGNRQSASSGRPDKTKVSEE